MKKCDKTTVFIKKHNKTVIVTLFIWYKEKEYVSLYQQIETTNVLSKVKAKKVRQRNERTVEDILLE